jgi:hypothetical protein
MLAGQIQRRRCRAGCAPRGAAIDTSAAARDDGDAERLRSWFHGRSWSSPRRASAAAPAFAKCMIVGGLWRAPGGTWAQDHGWVPIGRYSPHVAAAEAELSQWFTCLRRWVQASAPARQLLLADNLVQRRRPHHPGGGGGDHRRYDEVGAHTSQLLSAGAASSRRPVRTLSAAAAAAAQPLRIRSRSTSRSPSPQQRREAEVDRVDGDQRRRSPIEGRLSPSRGRLRSSPTPLTPTRLRTLRSASPTPRRRSPSSAATKGGRAGTPESALQRRRDYDAQRARSRGRGSFDRELIGPHRRRHASSPGRAASPLLHHHCTSPWRRPQVNEDLSSLT